MLTCRLPSRARPQHSTEVSLRKKRGILCSTKYSLLRNGSTEQKHVNSLPCVRYALFNWIVLFGESFVYNSSLPYLRPLCSRRVGGWSNGEFWDILLPCSLFRYVRHGHGCSARSCATCRCRRYHHRRPPVVRLRQPEATGVQGWQVRAGILSARFNATITPFFTIFACIHKQI